MKKIKDKEKMIKIGAVIGTVGVIGEIVSTICMRRKIRRNDERSRNADDYISEFCEFKVAVDADFDKRINANYEEIISNLEHIECLAKKLD